MALKRWGPNSEDEAIIRIMTITPGTPDPDDPEQYHPSYIQLCDIKDGVPIGNELVLKVSGFDATILPANHAEFLNARDFDKRYDCCDFVLSNQGTVYQLTTAIDSLESNWEWWIDGETRIIYIGREIIADEVPETISRCANDGTRLEFFDIYNSRGKIPVPQIWRCPKCGGAYINPHPIRT